MSAEIQDIMQTAEDEQLYAVVQVGMLLSNICQMKMIRHVFVPFYMLTGSG